VTYTENIFVCLAAPLVIALFLIRGEIRRFIGFFIIGLLSCLLSGYVSSFIVAAAKSWYYSMTAAESMIRLTPVCEEIMKAMSVFFYVAVLRPKRTNIITVALAVGLGFATLENSSYILQNGASEFFVALVRGFASGAMHAVCAAILGYGLVLVHNRERIAFTGAFAALCAATTFHGIYNLLVSAEGFWLAAGYALPTLAAAAVMMVIKYAELRIKD